MKRKLVLALAVCLLVTASVLFAWSKNIDPRYNDDLRVGFIDHHGKLAISPQYYEALDFSEGLAAVRRTPQENWLFIDKDGTIVVKPEAKVLDVMPFSDGLAAAQVSENIDSGGSIQAWTGKHWGPNIAPQASGRKWGFIDRSGKFTVNAKYDSVGAFREGLAPVLIDKKWGYIDKSNLVIPAQFDEAGVFSNGLAAVREGSKFGFIDKEGAKKIPCQFEHASDFKDGASIVRLDGQLIAIDSFGKKLSDDFDGYQPSKTGLFASHPLNHPLKKGPKFDSQSGKFQVTARGGYLVYKQRKLSTRTPYAYMDKNGIIKVDVKLPELQTDSMIGLSEFDDNYAVITVYCGDSNRYFICDEFGKVTPVNADQVFSFNDGRARILAAPDDSGE
ncbi:WG repeat-containing protein [Candidatus Obscuribacterales bacterium]|nr:WG repeat-containing protein [Candidatus Obscuribacterales bacterium]